MENKKVISNLEDYLFHYRAFCWEVTDGDTIKVDWDLGRRTKGDEIIRFSRFNAFEMKVERGEEAQRFVAERILNKKIIIKTELDRRELTKYGGFNRFLAEVFYLDEKAGGWVNLNDELYAAGLAVIYKS